MIERDHDGCSNGEKIAALVANQSNVSSKLESIDETLKEMSCVINKLVPDIEVIKVGHRWMKWLVGIIVVALISMGIQDISATSAKENKCQQSHK